MPYLAYCTDKADAGEIRAATRDAHLAYVENVMEKICVAGPLRHDPEGPMIASCFIYNTDDELEARALLENDPYHQAGLYASVDLKPFYAAAGTWVGGKNW